MTVGLATGMGYIGIAIVTGILISVLLFIYSSISFGTKPIYEKELKITIPENLDYDDLFTDLFEAYLDDAQLMEVRTSNMGSLYKLHYHIRFKSNVSEKDFLDSVRCRNGNLDIICGRVPTQKDAL